MKIRPCENGMKDTEVNGVMVGFVPFQPEFILVNEYEDLILTPAAVSMISEILYSVNGRKNWCPALQKAIDREVGKVVDIAFRGDVTVRTDFDCLRNLVIVYLVDKENK